VPGQSSQAQQYTVTNFGEVATAPLATNLALWFGDPAIGNFSFQTNGCSGAVLPPGGNCSLSVRFNATGVGTPGNPAVGGLLNVTDAVSGTTTTSFTFSEGRAANDVNVTPGPLDFGSVQAGTTSTPQIITFVNNQSVAAPISSIGIGGFAFGTNHRFAFGLVPPAGPGDCDPTGAVGMSSVAPGGTCTVGVIFNPPFGGRFDIATIVVNSAGSDFGYGWAGLTGFGVSAPDLVVSGCSGAFDDLPVGGSQTQTCVVTNIGATTSGTPLVSLDGLDTPHFTLLSSGCTTGLLAQESCTFSMRFNPTTTGPKSAEITVEDSADASDVTVIPLSGTALNVASISISPSAAQNYGAIPVGAESAPRTFTVRNAAGSAITGPINLSTGNADFVLRNDNCSGETLVGGSTCTVDVVYAPTGVAADSGAIQAAATPGGTVSTALSGSGESALRFTAEPAFSPPSVGVGSNADRTFTVQNAPSPLGGQPPPRSGPLVVTLGDAGGQYAIISQNCVSAQLDPGDTCDVTVRFTPATAGPHPGTLDVSATPGNSDSAALNGQGN
jgi:hypothetical protein